MTTHPFYDSVSNSWTNLSRYAQFSSFGWSFYFDCPTQAVVGTPGAVIKSALCKNDPCNCCSRWCKFGLLQDMFSFLCHDSDPPPLCNKIIE